jgi:hypothetical protein
MGFGSDPAALFVLAAVTAPKNNATLESTLFSFSLNFICIDGFVPWPSRPDCAASSKALNSLKFILANEQLQWSPGCTKHPEL